MFGLVLLRIGNYDVATDVLDAERRVSLGQIRVGEGTRELGTNIGNCTSLSNYIIERLLAWKFSVPVLACPETLRTPYGDKQEVTMPGKQG